MVYSLKQLNRASKITWKKGYQKLNTNEKNYIKSLLSYKSGKGYGKKEFEYILTGKK